MEAAFSIATPAQPSKLRPVARPPAEAKAPRPVPMRKAASVLVVSGLGALRRRQPLRPRRSAEPSAAEPTQDEVDLLQQVLPEVKELVVLQKTSKAVIQKLAESMVAVTAAAGDTVVRQGDIDDTMHVVADGDIIVQRKASEDEAPLERPASRGAYFGAECLLGNTPHKTSVVAKSDCRLFRLDRGVFDGIILAQTEEEDEDSEDEDEEDEDDTGETCSPADLVDIFIVSDSTGESASASVKTAMQQFNYCYGSTCGTSRTTVYRFLRTEDEAQKIVDAAAERNALLVYTVMQPNLHDALNAACAKRGVESCDLWEPLLKSLETRLGATRSGRAGRRQAVGEEYMRIVKAIEYTRKVDDGVLPNIWKECDIMLIGPSRAGKTPLSFYLAQRGYKVANYPLVPDEEPPKELFEIDQDKCFALSIKAEKLQSIRSARMKQFNRTNTEYANLSNIKKEVNWIKTFYMRRGPKWPVIDTTDAGVVETAARIMEILDRRKGDTLAAAYESPFE
mmetsp:Transcript_97559/g.173752  ORF Transcript_97559/g.173752 Transcript_97559/m.173752 type:complete len:508 (-) Transcript_97559:81-1604(-)